MTDAEELQGMETAERQHAQPPVPQMTAVEAIFLEEDSLEELQEPEEYSQDLEADSLEELQDPEEDYQLEEAWPEALELVAQIATASTLTTCSFEWALRSARSTSSRPAQPAATRGSNHEVRPTPSHPTSGVASVSPLTSLRAKRRGELADARSCLCA